MGVQELSAIIADASRPLLERQRALDDQLAIAGEAVQIKLPRLPSDERAIARGVLAALAAVIEPRLGLRPVLAKTDLVVLATPEEQRRLVDAELFDAS